MENWQLTLCQHLNIGNERYTLNSAAYTYIETQAVSNSDISFVLREREDDI